MLKYVIRKLLYKKWMSLSLLLGNTLLLLLFIATPVYTETSLQRSLDLRFNEYIRENNEYPVKMRVETPSVRGSDDVYTNILRMSERIGLTGDDLGMPVRLIRRRLFLSVNECVSDFPRRESGVKYRIDAMSDLSEHAEFHGGNGPENRIGEDGIIDAYVPESVMHRQRLTLGEILTFEEILVDGSPLKLRIAGDFVMKDPEDPYWVDSPADQNYRSDIFIDETLFSELFLTEKSEQPVSAIWVALYDYSNLQSSEIGRVLSVSERLSKYIRDSYSFSTYWNFRNYFYDFVNAGKQIRTTYLVLQVPVFVLLLLFVFMVSARIVENEETEIAVLYSRGVSKGQIFFMYLLQSLLLTVLSALLALPLSAPVVRVLSGSNGFLQFIRREDLKIPFTSLAFVYGGIGALAGILAMLLPALRYSGKSVIAQKEGKRRGMRSLPVWHRYFLDVIFLLVALYGRYSFMSREELLSSQVIAGERLDPLLFLSTAVFMAGAGLLILRLIPLFERLIFRITRNRLSPALFASHRQILGTGKEQGFVMTFLAMTVATGIFNASAARTIHENDAQNLSYLSGTDLRVMERWKDNTASLQIRIENGDEEAMKLPITYYEPDFGKYENIPGFSSVTKVYQGNGQLSFDGLDSAASEPKIMGIEPKLFGETAEFDETLMPVHWYEFLNALSRREDAVILSANYKAFGVKLGDRVVLRTKEKNRNESVTLTVSGFFEYWPGYEPEKLEIMADESTNRVPQYLAVARLDLLQKTWQILPYEVWLKAENDSTEGFYSFAEERGFPIRYVVDKAERIQKEASSSLKQGTSGIFTVSFIVSLLLCTVGFMIYWISSVKARELQFGVLRAMGMRFSEIVLMLLNEQFFVSVLSIGSGYLTGILTAKLFMPLLRIAYSSAEYPVPLLLMRKASDEIRLFVIIFLMLFVGIFVLSRIIRRMKISEALKLGED